MLDDLLARFGITWTEVIWSVVLFLITFFGSLAFTAWLVVRLPATYFSNRHPPAFAWEGRHPLARWAFVAGKNILGGILVIMGIIMSLPGVPGQGILTILIGLMFLDIPGRRKMEIKLVSMPHVYRGINKLRARFGKEPLVLDSPEHAESTTASP